MCVSLCCVWCYWEEEVRVCEFVLCVVYWEEEVRVCEFVLCVVYWEEEVRVCEFVLCGLLGGGGPCV